MANAIGDLRERCSMESEAAFDGRTAPLGTTPGRRCRVAIASLLFNWPSTGGGTIHTFELGQFLLKAGYDARHFYAVHPEWRIGQISSPLAVPAFPLRFSEQDWIREVIRDRFRKTLAEFDPDFVIVTDSWSTKPLLCEAASPWRYFIRIAALEAICPLNNVRMLFDDKGAVVQCNRNQLAEPSLCRRCVARFQRASGALHRNERTLAGFDEADYAMRLRKAFAGAEGVLVVNPSIAELIRPFAKNVQVVPSGFDPARFPADITPSRPVAGRKQVLFAGVAQEFMKGLHVVREAASILWRTRRDFELVVTSEAQNPDEPFVRWIGWQSQQALPQALSQAHVVVFPTVAQEALGRTAVEAMACGRPVVASRIGGLPWVVEDGATGLLFEPGDAAGLAGQLARLLDDDALSFRLGQAGRRKFEAEFRWDQVIRRHYAGLFGPSIVI
jgi:glycosyltransferase involved in cell wall biosynthesis